MYSFCKHIYKIIYGISFGVLVSTVAIAAVNAPNPRTTATSIGRTGRDVRALASRQNSTNVSRALIGRHATDNTAVLHASGRTDARSSAMDAKNRPTNQSRSALNVARTSSATPAYRTARAAINSDAVQAKSRSAAAKISRHAGGGRVAMARATELFDDISKISGGYSECRDAYATCMDQFCGKANETYRRCFCSPRFVDFRNTEEALDQAKVLLQAFEDNNLNAVDKTAEEVTSMYTATVGEAAIKNDTSGAQSILSEIGDLLAGKKKTTATSSTASTTSTGVLQLDFSSDIGNIWGDGGDVFASDNSSIFSNGGGQDLSGLEGEALYDAVHKQCQAMVANDCQSAAAFNMSKSSYSILISQDCNAYEKSVKSKREQVQQVVRQAEKILRQARLENYRAHNSQDVNACLDKVKAAMLAETACGPKYKRCLDFTGAYISQSTGEPIYTQRLFQLTELIELNGTDGDVVSQNATYATELDKMRNRATSALDTCQNIADTVWEEFKRMAIIEIAQAQDEKIEEVKGTCVQTINDCYDTKSNTLKEVDNTKAQYSGAMQAYTTKAMCEADVIACASLYGDTTGCSFDGNGRLVSGNGVDSAGRCGLTELLAYVDRVDSVRVAEGCAAALNKYVQEMCAPEVNEQGREYPWGCRKRSLGDIKTDIVNFAVQNCLVSPQSVTGTTTNDKLTALGNVAPDLRDVINNTVKSIGAQITEMLRGECYAITTDSTVIFDTTGLTFEGETNPEVSVSPTWLKNVFGSEAELTLLAKTGIYGYKLLLESGATKGSNISQPVTAENPKSLGYGVCTIPSVRQLCMIQDQLPNMAGTATYDSAKRVCNLADAWYEYRCRTLDGYFVGNYCYLK